VPARLYFFDHCGRRACPPQLLLNEAGGPARLYFFDHCGRRACPPQLLLNEAGGHEDVSGN